MPTSKKPAAAQMRFPNALKAERHLAKVDKKLARLITEVGRVKIKIDLEDSVFESLAGSIVYQQLHGKAAATILARFVKLFGLSEGEFPTPEAVLQMDELAMRGAGLSQAKMRSILDLAAKCLDGTIPDLARVREMPDPAIIEAFTQVKGIGVWTTHMFLIFTLGRPDILPTGDYGVRRGFGAVYGKKKMPTPKELEKFGELWKPFRSIGSWYMWRALEIERYRKIKF